MQECGVSLMKIKGLILYCKTPSCQDVNKKKPKNRDFSADVRAKGEYRKVFGTF
jgi:hypothetical protein